jgi:polyisoprenoid-binding protein YceI
METATRRATLAIVLLSFWLALATRSNAQQLVLHCDPSQTVANFTLGASLHTVHGGFNVKRCDIHFDPSSASISGEVAFDATTGQTGNDGRDRKMHKDVLESERYPEIRFRPDRVDGKVAPAATSTVQVHGMFAIHGAEHEITVPVDVKLDRDHWTASGHFLVPYVQWGMKNPSNFFLHVRDSVDVEFKAAGTAGPGS